MLRLPVAAPDPKRSRCSPERVGGLLIGVAVRRGRLTRAATSPATRPRFGQYGRAASPVVSILTAPDTGCPVRPLSAGPCTSPVDRHPEPLDRPSSGPTRPRVLARAVPGKPLSTRRETTMSHPMDAWWAAHIRPTPHDEPIPPVEVS